MLVSEQNLIWIDLEMTGLDTEQDDIIEIATIVTDGDLNILAEGPVLAIYCDDEKLDNMDKWNRRQHTKSGLLERVRYSTISLREAEKRSLDFIREYVPAGVSPMCGNSICQDRRFLYRQMPDLEVYFHYRHIDVSTLKELAKRWYPDIVKKFSKKSEHLALQDIRDSIDELKFYRRQLFASIF